MNRDRHLFALSILKGNSYDRELIAGVARFAAENKDVGFELVDIDLLLKSTRRDSFSGVICRLSSDEQSARLKRTGLLVVDLLYEHPRSHVSAVIPDDAGIGRLAAEHFLEQRFTNFAFFGYEGIAYSERRRDGFCERLRNGGFAPVVFEAKSRKCALPEFDRIPGYDLNRATDIRQLGRQLSRLPKPCAVFCCHDPRAVAVIRACSEIGIDVPKDIAVLGTDDDPVCCIFTSPNISSIDPSARQIGYEAANLISSLSEEDDRSSETVKTIPPKGIVLRDSSATYPISPRWLSDALVFIQRNALKGISAIDVFTELKLSHTLVQQAFRQKLGSSVQKEIVRVRMNHAEKMLLDPSISISTIAQACGFASMHYFSQAFTAAHGCSPSGWRSAQASHR